MSIRVLLLCSVAMGASSASEFASGVSGVRTASNRASLRRRVAPEAESCSAARCTSADRVDSADSADMLLNRSNYVLRREMSKRAVQVTLCAQVPSRRGRRGRADGSKKTTAGAVRRI